MSNRQSRRSFLTRGGLTLGALAVGIAPNGVELVPARKRTPSRLAVYRLDPDWGGRGCPKGGCHACRACHRHAKYKRFPTRAAANANRAHRHCRCKIKRAGTLRYSIWVRLFGKPGALKRRSIDLRSSRKLRSLYRLGQKPNPRPRPRPRYH